MKQSILVFCFSAIAVFLTGCGENDYSSNNISPAYGGADGFIGENYKDHGENPFVSVKDEPVSTFSVDADGGSYTNTRRYLNLGQKPPEAAVRIEEFINYFTFDYADPSDEENVALNSEISTCPWNEEHHLLRIGMKGKSIAPSEIPNSNYVFLIDVSGSMGAPEKLGILKAGFKTMVDNLRDRDKVAIVTYAGQAGLLLSSTYGSQKETIKHAIDRLGAGGSTAGAQGIITAYEIAEANFISEGNNRVIIGSDGDFNVGPSSTEELVELIEKKRESGIYLTVLGVGGGNLNEHMMEQIANNGNGNGNYEYIDNVNQIQKVFTHELAKFYTVAKDAKIQITFDSLMIDAYRLTGYENRKLENDEFERDSTDAGEIGATQTITALYELKLSNTSSGSQYAQFDFRYKKPKESVSNLIQHKVEGSPVSYQQASENMRFAAAVGGFGLLMKNSKYKGKVTKQMVQNLANGAMSFDPHGYRKEFVSLVSKTPN